MRTRGRARRPAERDDPRLGPEPDRPGHRVRLLLRARGDDRARVRPRRGDGQLQPGDGLDRLRHLRPAVLRAADARGRARRSSRSSSPRASSSSSGARRRSSSRPGWRPRACRCWAPSPRRSTSPRTAGASARLLGELGLKRAAVRDRALGRGGAGRRAGRRLPAARAAELRARRPRDGDRLRPRRPARLPATAANGSGREIFLDRFLENAIEVDVDALCDGEDVWIGGIMQHVEEAGIHSGDSACVLPPHSLGARDAGRDPRGHAPDRARARRGRADQRPVRRSRGRPLRDRGQPARLADGPVRLQGDRAAAGQARLPA